MIISELVEKLMDIQSEKGDLEIELKSVHHPVPFSSFASTVEVTIDNKVQIYGYIYKDMKSS